jgi:hypothetical protein
LPPALRESHGTRVKARRDTKKSLIVAGGPNSSRNGLFGDSLFRRNGFIVHAIDTGQHDPRSIREKTLLSDAIVQAPYARLFRAHPVMEKSDPSPSIA